MSTGAGLAVDSSETSSISQLDLCEIVAALIIPDLIKIETCDNGGSELPEDMVSLALCNIAEATFGSGSQHEMIINSETDRQILKAFGEDELSQNDKLIRRMVGQALCLAPDKVGKDSGPEILELDSLTRALTSDLHFTEEAI